MFEQIKSDRMAAMGKDKVKFNILSVVVGELQRNASKVVTNDTVCNVLKKMISDITETLKTNADEKLLVEKEILSQYMPKQLSDDELMEIMRNLISTDESMKERKNMFPFLKKTYVGQYDGAVAAKLFSKL